jgi:TolB-like protein/DNA-binding winged helix-turn-helix (wHTH) protein/Tfp pilus assembly protein PilF
MAVPTETPQVIRFGDFELDLQAEELRKGGTRVKIQEQPSQVLLALVSRRGELVTRDELSRQLWPTDTFVDFETGLNRSIAKLREVLGDSPEAPRYIKTVPRKGYRFIAPIEPASGPRSEETTVLQTPARASAENKRWLKAALVLTGIFLAFAAYWTARVVRGFSSSVPHERIMLAVLPFENLTGDPGQEFFIDGVTEETIAQLGRLRAKDLGVIARGSAMKYKNTSKSVSDIAKELHVDYIVEGSVRRESGRVRVGVELIRASDESQVWADTYDRSVADVLVLQSEIARTIGQQLEVHLAAGQLSQQQSGYAVATPKPTAYEDYLRGRAYVFAGFDTPQALRRAQSYFEQAIKEDPNFGRAYAGLGASYLLLSEFRWLPPKESYLPARNALEKALQLDMSLGEAHTALGSLTWRYDWDWPGAEKEYRYACELDPNDVDAHQGLTWFLAWSRRSAEALSEIEKIREIDPAQAFTIDQAGVYFHLRDYKSLIAVSQKAVASRPDFWVSHYFLGVGYEGSGRLSEAISEYRNAAELSQGDTDPTAALAHAYARAGQRTVAYEILYQLQQRAKNSYVSPYMIATIYAGMGDNNKAFASLDAAYEERSSDLPYFLRADLRIDNLRSDPRLLNLENRLQLP